MSAPAATSASAASSSATSSQQPAYNDTPPVTRVHLHRHALESIFACLRFGELAVMMSVSRDWQAAVGSMRSMGRTLRADPKLLNLFSSRLRRHVTTVYFDHTYPASPEILMLLHLLMPHLSGLVCNQLKITAGVTSLLLPNRLQVLALSYIRAHVAEANMLLRSIGQLSQLQKLELGLQHRTSLSFAPLAALPQLRVLRVRWADASAPLLSDSQVDEFRALTDLDEFSVQMDAASVVRLLRSPHGLRWQSMPQVSAHSGDICTLLPGLSCLTEFPVDAPCAHFDWLPRMQSLTQLSVCQSGQLLFSQSVSDSLFVALQRCPRITSLFIGETSTPVNSGQLASLANSMPSLRTLSAVDASLPSLSFLALPPFAHALQHLSLQHLLEPRPKLVELRHLYGLRSLRHLTLVGALDEPLDGFMRSLLQPPSLLLPGLQSFECRL